MRLVLANATHIRPLRPKDRRRTAADLVREIQAATDGDRLMMLVGTTASFPGKVMEWLVSAATVPAAGQSFFPLQVYNSVDTMVPALEKEWEGLNSSPHPTDPQATSLVAVIEAELFARLAVHYGRAVTEAEAQELRLLVIDTEAL